MLGIKEIPANETSTNIPQEWHKPRGDTNNNNNEFLKRMALQYH